MGGYETKKVIIRTFVSGLTTEALFTKFITNMYIGSNNYFKFNQHKP